MPPVSSSERVVAERVLRCKSAALLADLAHGEPAFEGGEQGPKDGHSVRKTVIEPLRVDAVLTT